MELLGDVHAAPVRGLRRGQGALHEVPLHDDEAAVPVDVAPLQCNLLTKAEARPQRQAASDRCVSPYQFSIRPTATARWELAAGRSAAIPPREKWAAGYQDKEESQFSPPSTPPAVSLVRRDVPARARRSPRRASKRRPEQSMRPYR